jgi:hypothetical protein
LQTAVVRSSAILDAVLGFAVLAALGMMSAVTQMFGVRSADARIVTIIALAFAALGLLWFGVRPRRRARLPSTSTRTTARTNRVASSPWA